MDCRCALFERLEFNPAVEDDDGSRLSIVSRPSAEPGADPDGEGEGALGVGVLLPGGPAFEVAADLFEQGAITRVEGVGQEA